MKNSSAKNHPNPEKVIAKGPEANPNGNSPLGPISIGNHIHVHGCGSNEGGER